MYGFIVPAAGHGRLLQGSGPWMAPAGQRATDGPCRAVGHRRPLQGSRPGLDSAGQRAIDGPCRGALNTESRVQGPRVDEFVCPNSSAGFPSYGLGRGVSVKGAWDGRGSVWLFW